LFLHLERRRQAVSFKGFGGVMRNAAVGWRAIGAALAGLAAALAPPAAAAQDAPAVKAGDE
jgi:hypothetical protein